MSNGPWTQNGYGLRFEWGPGGVTQVADRSGALVIVDVLSFTTSVTVAAAHGVAAFPAAWRDARAGQLARQVDAVLAVGRREVTAEHPWSLSPAALEAAIALFDATASLPDAVRRCASGVELGSGGFGEDVEVAVQLDANDVVPVLTDGAFQAA